MTIKKKVDIIVDVEIDLDDVPVKEIIRYVYENLLTELVARMTKKEILEHLLENDEIGYDDILDAMDKEEIAEYLNNDLEYGVSGHFVIKSENLNQTMAIESFVKKLRTYC